MYRIAVFLREDFNLVNHHLRNIKFRRNFLLVRISYLYLERYNCLVVLACLYSSITQLDVEAHFLILMGHYLQGYLQQRFHWQMMKLDPCLPKQQVMVAAKREETAYIFSENAS